MDTYQKSEVDQNMKEKLIRFMQGRYGTDTLSQFLLICGLVVVLFSSFSIQRYGADDLVCGRMGIDHLLLLPDVFAECDETLCGESGISCANI